MTSGVKLLEELTRKLPRFRWDLGRGREGVAYGPF